MRALIRLFARKLVKSTARRSASLSMASYMLRRLLLSHCLEKSSPLCGEVLTPAMRWVRNGANTLVRFKDVHSRTPAQPGLIVRYRQRQRANVNETRDAENIQHGH